MIYTYILFNVYIYKSINQILMTRKWRLRKIKIFKNLKNWSGGPDNLYIVIIWPEELNVGLHSASNLQNMFFSWFSFSIFVIFYKKTSNGSKSMKFSSLDLAIAPNRREYQNLRIEKMKFGRHSPQRKSKKSEKLSSNWVGGMAEGPENTLMLW